MSRIRAAISEQEIPTTAVWRGIMKRARKAHGLSQTQLAGRLGVKQPTVSGIESGTIAQSKYVPAICVALSIPGPLIEIESEDDYTWLVATRTLRRDRPSAYKRWLQMVVDEAAETEK